MHEFTHEQNHTVELGSRACAFVFSADIYESKYNLWVSPLLGNVGYFYSTVPSSYSFCGV